MNNEINPNKIVNKKGVDKIRLKLSDRSLWFFGKTNLLGVHSLHFMVKFF
jgi:hypothetical protein